MALSATEMCCLETNTKAPFYSKVSPCFPASYGDDVRFHLMLLAIQAHICALILYNLLYCTYTHAHTKIPFADKLILSVYLCVP